MRKNTMMAQQRLDLILRQVQQQGMINAGEAAKRFDVSVETIRRDLELLEKQGQIKRVYGGAVSCVSKGMEPQYDSREQNMMEEKAAIARKTAEIIKDGETIAVDVGTTTLEVAKRLRDKRYITCLTNSLPVGMELARSEDNRVYILGGRLRYGDYSTSGFMTGAGLENFRVDTAIIGAGGVSVKNGVTDYHVEEANIRRTMIAIAEQAILVADSSKFNNSTFIQVCKLQQLSCIVTDWKVSPEVVRDIRALSIRVEIAQEL